MFLDGKRFHKDVTWIEHTVDIQWIVQNMKIYCKSWLTHGTTGVYDSAHRKHKETNMSKKWKAINKVTGEPWKPSSDRHQFLVMYDTGFVAVVTDAGWDGHWFDPLDMTKYYIVYKTKWLKTLTNALQSISKAS